jgi:transcriptional regulator with XRE-family HTH domain
MKTLREWRAERLLSVRALALAAGVSTKTITEIEYSRQTPSFRTIRRLAGALDVQPREVTEFAAAMDQAAEGKEAA